MSNWSPKPLRPDCANPLFPMEEQPVIVKAQTDLERQRSADGSQYASYARPSALCAPAVELYIEKGSLAGKIGPKNVPPKADPPIYDSEQVARVVKSWLALG